MSPRDLVVIDVETSGTNPFEHELLSVALVPFVGARPPMVVHVNHEAIAWTQYGKLNFQNFESEWRACAKSPLEAVTEIESYLEREFGSNGAIAVGHNVGFDLSFLKRLAHQAGRSAIAHLSHRSLDTHSALLLLQFRNEIPVSALTSDGAFGHFHIAFESKQRHTAIGDAQATKLLLQRLFDQFQIHSA